MLARLNPPRSSRTRASSKTYRRMLGGGHQSLIHAYFSYLGQIGRLDFGISTRTTRRTSPRSSRARSRIRSSSWESPSFSRFVLGTTVGMIAAWRRGGAVDNIVVPTLLSLSAFPAFSPRSSRSTSSASSSAGSRSSTPMTRALAGLQLHLPRERLPPRPASDPRDHVRVRRRLGAQHAHRHDQHDRGGLRGDGRGQGPARPPRDDALRRSQRHPAAPQRLRRPVRDRRRRPRLIEFVFSYPGAGFTLQQAALGSDYPLTQGLLLVFAVCVIVANFIMDLLNLVLDRACARVRQNACRKCSRWASTRPHRAPPFRSACSSCRRECAGARLPGLPLWLRLLLHNPKSCIGLIVLGGMLVVAISRR